MMAVANFVFNFSYFVISTTNEITRLYFHVPSAPSESANISEIVDRKAVGSDNFGNSIIPDYESYC